MRMILLTLSLLIMVGSVQPHPHPVACTDDVHCPEGYFCLTTSHSCRECLTCEHLRRRPASKEYTCISSEDQCGPCLQGLMKVEANWGSTCLAPEARNMRWLPSFTYFVITCIATCVLLSFLFIHGIRNTHIIKVNINIPTTKEYLAPQMQQQF